MPKRPKTKPMRAFSEARRKSIASVMVAPIPTAAPLIAPTTGLRQAWMARVTRPPVSRTPLWMSAASSCSCMSVRLGESVSSRPKTLPATDKSIPAQNARPAPVTRITRTSSSMLARLKACSNSLAISTVKAFICSGRFGGAQHHPSDSFKTNWLMPDTYWQPSRHLTTTKNSRTQDPRAGVLVEGR
ncbi:hypothetical protein D9M69_494480 [compost metagenome]